MLSMAHDGPSCQDPHYSFECVSFCIQILFIISYSTVNGVIVSKISFIYYCLTQNDLAETSTISEYNLEGEGDLFRALEPIIEEPIVGLDYMTAAMSLISCCEDVITSQELKAADIESFQNEQLLEVLYECEKDLMAQGAIGTTPAAVLDIDTSVVKTNESQNRDASFEECVSSDCLSSMESMQGAAVEPIFLDFTGMDFGSVYGMRRAFSEGDIKVSLIYFFRCFSTFLLL